VKSLDFGIIVGYSFILAILVVEAYLLDRIKKLLRQIRHLAAEIDPLVDDFGEEIKAPKDRTHVQVEKLWDDDTDQPRD
jgi:hypothetical protein